MQCLPTQKTSQDDESTAEYLGRAKILLECNHCTSKLSDISGFGLDNWSLVQGRRESHICRRVMKEQESWKLWKMPLRASIGSPGLKSEQKLTTSYVQLCMTIDH